MPFFFRFAVRSFRFGSNRLRTLRELYSGTSLGFVFEYADERDESLIHDREIDGSFG
jgi:hypothetical protein